MAPILVLTGSGDSRQRPLRAILNNFQGVERSRIIREVFAEGSFR